MMNYSIQHCDCWRGGIVVYFMIVCTVCATGQGWGAGGERTGQHDANWCWQEHRRERGESLESSLWVVSVCVCVFRKKIIEEGKCWNVDIWVYSKISSLLRSLCFSPFSISCGHVCDL